MAEIAQSTTPWSAEMMEAYRWLDNYLMKQPKHNKKQNKERNFKHGKH
jgi:hypothetical protein